MNIRLRNLLRTSYLLLPLLLSLAGNGCTDSKPNEHELVVASRENDSLQKWIGLARNRKKPDVERLHFLDKAFALTQSIPEDSIRVGYFSRVSMAATSLNDSLRFRKINNKTIQLARKINKKRVEAEALWDLAFFFKKTNVQDSSYYHYGKALDIYNMLGDNDNAGRVLLYMAIVQQKVKDFTGSEINVIRAIKHFKAAGTESRLFTAYNTLAIDSRGLKEYDNAIAYYNKALENIGNDEFELSRRLLIRNNIGFVFQEQGRHQEALEIFKSILEVPKLKHINPSLYATVLDNYAVSQFKSGEVEGVEEKMQKALAIRDSLNDFDLAESHYYLSEFYASQQHKDAALEAALAAQATAKESTNNEVLLKSLKLLGQLDNQNANKYVDAYIRLNDSLQQEERKIRNKFARIQFETNETLEQNRLLAKQKQLWIGIATALLLLALAAFMIIDQRVKNQKLRFQKEQQESNEKIFTLMLDQKKKVEEGKKIAQKRISEELHDGVQGRIQGVRMVLLGLNKRTTPEAVEERGEAIKELMDIQEEVRVISHELSHAAYQKIHNFIQSIEELLQGVKTSAALEYTFAYDDEVEWDGLSSDIKVNLYRMVQECLQNCVKHAKAGKVALEFAVQNRNQLRVTLTDDGKGFVVKKGKKGIGLRNITSRIEKIGGKWDLESAVGKGTTVTFHIPIRLLDPSENQLKEQALQEV